MANPVGDDVPAVLVVDDHAANLLAIEAVLEPLGYRVVTARSGAEALKRLLDHDFVLIVMDVHMPGLDGYQTTALIRQRPRSRNIPVVFLTAVYNQPEHTHRGYALGAVNFITKPFDPEVLRGKVRAFVGLYTQGRQTERERAEESERIKDLFLGAVGHDLRNPLSAILLAAQQVARDGGCNNAHHSAHGRKIDRAGRRMQRMIEDILDLTRNQFAGGIPLTPKAMDARDVCRTVVDEQQLAHPDRIIKLDVAGDVAGYWDADRLARVLSNLVGNAMDHGEKGPVHVGVRDHDDHIVLDVHNGGTPIDPEMLPRIFEPFHRGDSGVNGLGLGLYIVREIARAHRGSVEVRSTASEGTTFEVTLPKHALG